MTLRQILTEPNEILRQKSLPVENVDKNIQILMDDMLATMHAAPGIGLAAIQVGIPKRVIVLDIEKKEGEKNPIFLVNPEIVEKSEDMFAFQEGCLSFPNEVVKTMRYKWVKVKADNHTSELFFTIWDDKNEDGYNKEDKFGGEPCSTNHPPLGYYTAAQAQVKLHLPYPHYLDIQPTP